VSAPSTTAVDAGLSANTLYSYQVSAVDNAGNESAKSGAVSLTTPLCPDTTPPNTPAGLSANSQSCTNVSLSWNASTDPTVSGQITSGLKWYNLYRSGTWLKFVTGTSTTDSGVTGSTSYSYQVSAVDNANNESALSGAVGVTTPGCSSSATPARNLKLTRSGETAILQWSGTTGCLYQAECSLSLSGPWVPVDAPTTSFSVMSVAPLQPSAVYRVALFTNTAKYLANVTVNQNDKNLPTVPSGLTAVSNLFSEVNLSWLGSIDSGTTVGGTTYTSGLSGYLIYRNNIFLKKVDAPTTSTLDTGVNLATPCQYTVAAIDNAGNVSAKSVAASPFTTPVPPPSVPTSLGGGATTCTSIILSWNASTDTGGPGLAGYNVFRNGSFLIQVPGNGWTDNGLAASSTYSYAVSAVDTTGLESSQSAALSITTPACPDTTPPSVPSGLTGSAPSCTSASLSWNASTDPTVSGQTTSGLKGYYLYRNGVFVQQVLAPLPRRPTTGCQARQVTLTQCLRWTTRAINRPRADPSR